MTARDVELRSPVPAPAAAVRAWLERSASARRLRPDWGEADAIEDAAPVPSVEADGEDRSVLVQSLAAQDDPSRRKLARFRHERIRRDLERLVAPRLERPLHVAIGGSSGLVGTALRAFLEAGGHVVSSLVRRATGDASDRGEIAWDLQAGTVDVDRLARVDAVVNLAGAGIADGRWTDKRKRLIRDSRVAGSGLLARALAQMSDGPRTLVNASAIGFYGDRGDETVDESSPPGEGFLAETCLAWEGALEPAEQAGVRVVRPRIGVVLNPGGGALAKMLPIFRVGLGGKLGSGRQFMSWIALDELVGVLFRAICDTTLSGPLNAVAPTPVRNAEFTRVLAHVLERPALAPAPAFAIRLAMGQMGSELLLTGARVVPSRLQSAGFGFAWPDLESALRWELGRPDPQTTPAVQI